MIGGYTPPQGSRPYIGALLLGAYKGEDLHFVGKVGTGFTEETLAALAKQFRHFFVERARSKGEGRHGWNVPQIGMFELIITDRLDSHTSVPHLLRTPPEFARPFKAAPMSKPEPQFSNATFEAWAKARGGGIRNAAVVDRGSVGTRARFPLTERRSGRSGRARSSL